MKKLLFLAVAVCVQIETVAQIAAGPMLGYVDMREALVWVQTIDRAEVVLKYTDEESKSVHYSQPVNTEYPTAFTAKLIADQVEPGRSYSYDLVVNGRELKLNGYRFKTQELWQHRTDPPAFTLATGSCAYINEPQYDRPGKGYGGEYGIFEKIADAKPDVMLWLGDNIYLREPDWSTRTGILHRYSHARATTELQRLLSACPHYAIWDDHDYGPNDADRSFIHKELTLEAFELFWGNPSFGLPGMGGITTAFQFNGIDFFLLDNRWFRSNYKVVGTEKELLGKQQIDWLIEALRYSRAPFKIVAVGGQFLSDLAVYENHANYAEEREYLLERLNETGTPGVIFLSGDRHHTELSMLTLENGEVVYDFTVSPLTSTAYDPKKETNTHRVEGTEVGERNFATLHFSGPQKERRLELRVFNAGGQLLWERVIQRTPAE